MQLILTTLEPEQNDTAAPVVRFDQLIAIDPDRCLTSPGETPLDLLLEVVLANSKAIRSTLDTLAKNGLSHARGAVLPGAVTAIWLHPDLAEAAARQGVAQLVIDHIRETVRLPDGREVFQWDLGGIPQDRASEDSGTRRSQVHWSQVDRNLLEDLTHDRLNRPATSPRALLATALLTGLLEASPLADGQPIDRAALNGTALTLTGSLLALVPGPWLDLNGQTTLDSGQPADQTLAFRWGGRELANAFRSFQKVGILASDRGWMPRAWVAGHRFTDVAALLDDPESRAQRALGARLSPIVLGLPEAIAREALKKLIAHVGDDENRHMIDRRGYEAPSSHDRIAVGRVLSRLAEVAGADLGALENSLRSRRRG